MARNETSNHVLKADIKDKDFCKFVPVTTCTCVMYKILFLVFFFSLSNSEKTGDCPTDYLDGKYYYCYHIGTKAMTLSEARRYCESKNDGILAIPEFLTDYMQNELMKIARWYTGDTKWWVNGRELELEHVDVKSFKVNDLHHLQKRKPICQIYLPDYHEY